MIGVGVYKYSLNEDATVVSFKQYYGTSLDIYPSLSVCITSPFEEDNLKALGSNVTSKKYVDFLMGSLKKDELFKIDYKNVSLNPIDYVLGYDITYRNQTVLIKITLRTSTRTTTTRI